MTRTFYNENSCKNHMFKTRTSNGLWRYISRLHSILPREREDHIVDLLHKLGSNNFKSAGSLRGERERGEGE